MSTDFQRHMNAIIVDGAFKTLMIDGWTPDKFLKAYQEHHQLADHGGPLDGSPESAEEPADG